MGVGVQNRLPVGWHCVGKPLNGPNHRFQVFDSCLPLSVTVGNAKRSAPFAFFSAQFLLLGQFLNLKC
jgi:hypothetical protein